MKFLGFSIHRTKSAQNSAFKLKTKQFASFKQLCGIKEAAYEEIIVAEMNRPRITKNILFN